MSAKKRLLDLLAKLDMDSSNTPATEGSEITNLSESMLMNLKGGYDTNSMCAGNINCSNNSTCAGNGGCSNNQSCSTNPNCNANSTCNG